MIQRMTTAETIMMSLRELMTEEPFDNITVRDICDNCRISKATFYRYYLDKYDLLAHVYQSYVSPLIDNIENIDDYSWKNMLEDALAIVEENRTFFRNGFKNARGQNSFSEASADFDIECAIRIINRVDQNFCRDERNLFVLRSYIMGYRIILDRLFVSEEPLDIDLLVGYIYDCMPEKVRAVLPWE